MTTDEMRSGAVRRFADRDPELADRIMWRVQDGEISDDEAFGFVLEFAQLSNDNRRS